MTDSCWKIAFVLPAMPGGGLEVSMLRIASYLNVKGHKVSMFTTEDPGAWFTRIKAVGLTGRHIPGLRQGFPHAHARRVGRLLREGEFDVVFTVFDRFSQAVLGMLPDKVIIIPLLRNDHPETYEIGLANQGAWNIAVANSPTNTDQARKLVPNRPIVLIPNGVELPKKIKRRADFGRHSPLRLIFVGRLVHESKGVLLLPDIFRGVTERGLNCILTIAGDGIDRDTLKKRFEQDGLMDKVTFTGMVGREEVISLVRSSHVLLFPSFYEGLPNVVLEAQANGCVPIATLLPGVTDFLVKDGETGYLVAPNNVLGFVDRITDIYRDPEMARQMADNAFRLMQKEFSGEHEGSRYIAVIEQAMAGKYPLPYPRHHGPRLDCRLFPKQYLRKKRLSLIKKYLPDWLLNTLRTLRCPR